MGLYVDKTPGGQVQGLRQVQALIIEEAGAVNVWIRYRRLTLMGLCQSN